MLFSNLNPSLRSVFVVLNGCCLASLLGSLPSLAVIFRGLPVLLRSFTLPVWFTRCFNGFTVWGCYSLICKIDLYVIDGTLTGQKYRDQILHSLVVPQFDGHP
jgi:hypothetical protein